MRALPLRSVYATPGAICAAPDYARRLVGEAGVDSFVVRTGFEPTAASAALGRAIEHVKAVGAECWLLVGAWWGQGVEPGNDAMTPLADDLLASGSLAHEAQWQMFSPGGSQDDVIEASLVRLCQESAPDGICLTHARYRHPAAISGMFEVGGEAMRVLMGENGISESGLSAALLRVHTNLQRMDVSGMTELASGKDLVTFLDAVASEDVFSHWFTLRAELVTRSVQRFSTAVARCSSAEVRFGTNAFAPGAAFACGQDYGALVATCDVVQPLLGYIDWHVVQPIHAWSDFLVARVGGLTDRDATGIASALLGFGGRLDAPYPGSTTRAVDRSPEVIEPVVLRQLDLLQASGLPLQALQPVLHGSGWPVGTSQSLDRHIAARGFGGVVYQGTADLVGPVPVEGWS